MSPAKKAPTQALPEAFAEHLALAVAPAELSHEQRDRMRRRIVDAARDATPTDTFTVRAEEVRWKKLGEFIEVRELQRDDVAGTHVSVVRMHPGATVAPHRHAKDELFFILEGECHIGSHRLRAGDVHLAKAGSAHDTITTQTGVLVLVRGEYPYPGA